MFLNGLTRAKSIQSQVGTGRALNRSEPFLRNAGMAGGSAVAQVYGHRFGGDDCYLRMIEE